MKNLHKPASVHEALHSPITLVTGTALLATAVLLAYNHMRNAQGEVLLDVAAGNLVSMAKMMIG